MKTAHKIALARLAYHAVRLGRTIAGQTDRCVVTRGGIQYDLDLRQGIDFAIYLGGMFEKETRQALSELVRPAALVLDIGANIGAHTLHLASCVGPQGRVMAFEPTEFAYGKLRRNLELNPTLASRTTAYHCFLAANDSAEIPHAIYSSWPLAQDESGRSPDDDFHAKHLGKAMSTSAAEARSIDSILSEQGCPHPQLVKLDVDGFECEILRGAEKLLRESKPIFVMELAPYVLDERGASLDELLSLFVPRGYDFYDEKTKKQLPGNASQLQRLIRDGESINVIARAD